MFHLTRREQMLVAALSLAFLTGLAVKHYRALGETGAISTTEKRDAKY